MSIPQHMMRVLLLIALTVWMVGCVNNSMVTKQEDFEETDRTKWTVEDYFAHAEYDSLETELRRSLEGCDPVDRPMFRVQLASVLLQEGKRDEAHRTLTEAREELNKIADYRDMFREQIRRIQETHACR